jgi:hypothetical protein
MKGPAGINNPNSKAGPAIAGPAFGVHPERTSEATSARATGIEYLETTVVD